MSYQEMSEQAREMGRRSRIEMCVREQGQIFAGDGRADIAALGRGVVSGTLTDIDAVIMAVCVGPNWDVLNNDSDLLAAVQAVWPTVASARYPQT